MSNDSRQLSAVLHELKNPILAIERLSDILLENDQDFSSDTKRKIELIHTSAKEASGYLEDLDFSSPPVLADDFSFAPVDVSALAERVVESFQPHAEYKDQTLRRAEFADEAMVVGDEVRLLEAMKNIVNNALKYSPRGETVDVQVQKTEAEVRFAVSDSGPGLSEDDLDRLFKPFQRLGQQPTDGEVSLGLGLYLVNEIISRHDGEVDVETEKGRGSIFTLILPAASVSANHQ
ncbi:MULTISPECIES: sensor histidine kinase [Salinibacter]|jgi:signal transduction histidine kinase|uniref:sensor histidine kinase n=2 Tax=Salinibacteraceae TaxID=1853225 RepID=UPI001ABAD6BA|nr:MULTISPECIES: HAMP domain-containing sensor histidine kinase [Salinibacter]